MTTSLLPERVARPRVVVEVELEGRPAAEDLVRELELRALEAETVDGNGTVLVTVRETDDGLPLLLEPLVALEGWLGRHGVDEAAIHVDGERHVVRAHGDKADEVQLVRLPRSRF